MNTEHSLTMETYSPDDFLESEEEVMAKANFTRMPSLSLDFMTFSGESFGQRSEILSPLAD